MPREESIVIEGVEEARGKVIEFVKKAADSLETEGELKVTLHQTAKSGDMDVYETVYAFDETIDQLVDELLDKACDDAVEIGHGRIKYSVKVEGVKGRVTFGLKIPEREDSDEDDIDEVPNKRGLISQQMRHNEILVKTAVGASKDTLDMLRGLLRDANHRIAVLEKERMETFKSWEELLSMKQVRDLEFMKLQNSERRKDQVGHVLMQGLPILAAKLLGGGTKQAVEMMGAKTPLEQMLEGFLMTFDQSQLQKIAQSDLFAPAQKAALMEIISYVIERQQAEEARNKGQTNGSANGAAPHAQGPQGP
jgi:hypothetical protein